MESDPLAPDGPAATLNIHRGQALASSFHSTRYPEPRSDKQPDGRMGMAGQNSAKLGDTGTKMLDQHIGKNVPELDRRFDVPPFIEIGLR